MSKNSAGEEIPSKIQKKKDKLLFTIYKGAEFIRDFKPLFVAPFLLFRFLWASKENEKPVRLEDVRIFIFIKV